VFSVLQKARGKNPGKAEKYVCKKPGILSLKGKGCRRSVAKERHYPKEVQRLPTAQAI
jgi:hypothetical protein